MREFYKAKSALVSPSEYIDEWTNLLLRGAESKEDTSKRLQSLSSGIASLWKAFNTERAHEDLRHLLETQRGVESYLAAFLLTNVQRTYSIFSKQEMKTALTRVLHKKQKLVIADIGAGPLSATVGLLSALGEELGDLLLVEIHAIERSSEILEAGIALLEPALNPRVEIRFEHHASAKTLPKGIDIALFANVLNELEFKHRETFVADVVSLMSPKGICLLLEPGQDVHSRALGDLRDTLLLRKFAQGKKLSVVSPCLHNLNCPLSSRSGRRDWCWFQNKWSAPVLLLELDKMTGLDHVELSFSFVALSFEAVKSDAYARVVSDFIPLDTHGERRAKALAFTASNLVNPADAPKLETLARETNISKELLCTSRGTLEASLNEGLPRSQRGELYQKHSHDVLAKERTQATR